MLLRRITQHVKNQNWFAVGLDFVIVVVGVFIGIQVSNWNDAQNRRADERVIIERLVTEFNLNLDLLAADKTTHEAVVVATSQLLSMIGPDPVVPEDETAMAETLLACLTNPVFVPRLGTTNSLIASGDIRLIVSGGLQAKVTEWPSRAQEISNWQTIERHNGEGVILNLTFDYVAWPNIDKLLGYPVEESRFDSDYRGLLSSRRLEGMLDGRRWNHREIIESIEELESDTAALIDGLQSRLNSL